MSADPSPPAAPAPTLTPRREGVLASVTLPHPAPPATADAWLDALPEAERALALTFAAPRRLAFVGGRLALRAALAHVAPTHAATPVLRTPRGAPQPPAGVLASVSHKRRLAVALAGTAGADGAHTLGVDLEERPDVDDLARPDLAPKILTARERHALAPLRDADELAYRVAVRVHFALKEAVYKAIDPHVHRHVRFQEVELAPADPTAPGDVPVRLLLPEFAGTGYAVRASWEPYADHLLAIAIGPAR